MDVSLTQTELWALQEHVRVPVDKRSLDQVAQEEIHWGLLDGSDPITVSLPLDYLWRAEGQISPNLRVGSDLVGRSLLLKVFRALQGEGLNLDAWSEVLTRAQERLVQEQMEYDDDADTAAA